jgi:hypothetical protein
MSRIFFLLRQVLNLLSSATWHSFFLDTQQRLESCLKIIEVLTLRLKACCSSQRNQAITSCFISERFLCCSIFRKTPSTPRKTHLSVTFSTINPCGIYGGQSGTERRRNASDFFCQDHSTTHLRPLPPTLCNLRNCQRCAIRFFTGAQQNNFF